VRPSLLLLLALPALAAPRKPTQAPDPAATAALLLGQALSSDEAYEELRELCDDIGHRISGSPQLDAAIDWGMRRMTEDGLAVTLEPVDVPRWVRGPAKLELLPSRAGLAARELAILALGSSVSTPPEGIEAEVYVVSSFDAFDPARAKGKIVVWDAPFVGYGETVRYRGEGASVASRAGAVASLVRSVTDRSLYTPHTGNQRYAADVIPIPAAAITPEDAATLHRLQDHGSTPRLRLQLTATTEADVRSANVVGELRGRERPEEIVVLGCHLDSWDVGQGAQDDGAGCVTVMQAGALLAALPQAPRRTVRVVLFTNEENGLRGGKAYAAAHASERIVAAVEDDTGAGAPLGFSADLRDAKGDPDPAAFARLQAALQPQLGWLRPVGAAHLEAGWSGADIGGVVENGALGFGLEHDMSGYWIIHHTDADTFEKVDPDLVRRNVAAMTVFAWALAETPELLPAVQP
jgi:carboxypeptidase Q